MGPGASARAFISYARADGEVFATDLRTRLERDHPEISLWMDRSNMEGGIGWWTQIAAALDDVEILIMVMTPAASASEVALKEWRYARQQGVRICPVFRGSNHAVDFSSLPTWMRKAHFYDLDKEWETFIAFVRSPHRVSRVPFMAPDLRAGFVSRPKEYEALAAQLVDRDRMEPIAQTTALQGSGGFGKTTLAVALCHDEDIITAFDDGVLWVTLGQKPNVLLELTKLYAAFTGDRPSFVDVDDAAVHLSAHLDSKSCLLVIDDVWDKHHVEPFLRGGSTCARLITTRQLNIVSDIRAARVLVNEMNEDESVRMLQTAFPASLPDPEVLRGLARRLGEWPLLLKLAASQLRSRLERGDTPEGALAFVDRALAKRGAVAFDRASSASRNDAIATTVGASLDLLSAADRQRCAELSIFAADRAIPASAVRALWGVDELDTETLLQELDSAALLDFDLRTATVRIHDVFRAYLSLLLKDAPEIHRRLVQHGWPNPYALPDAYAWRWYTLHAARSGVPGLLRTVLFDFDWMLAKVEATEIQALVADYDFLDHAAEPAARLLQDALRLSSAALSRHPGQLATQLAARLTRGVFGPIDDILTKAESRAAKPWFRLMHRSLTLPGGPLFAILKTHTQAIGSLVLSADGRWLVSCSRDWTLRLLDLETFRVDRSFEHPAPVTCAAVSFGRRIAVSGSEDRIVRAWDMETGASLREHRYHSGVIHAIALAPDERQAYSIAEDGKLCRWDLESGRVEQLVGVGSHRMQGLAVTPDGVEVLFGSGDAAISTFDLNRHQVTRTFEGHTGVVRALALSADGRHLASGSEDNTIRVWEMQSGKVRAVLEGHTDVVNAVTLSPDATQVVSASADKSIRVWDVSGRQPPVILEGHSSWVTAVASHVDGRRVITGSGDSTIRVWDVTSAAAAQPARSHQSMVAAVAISSDGRRAVSSGNRAEEIRVWDVANHRVEHTLSSDGQLAVLDLHPDGNRLLAAGADNTVQLWDLNTATAMHVFRGHSRPAFAGVVAAGGSRAISLSRDRTLRVWDLESGRPFVGHRGSGQAGSGSALVDLTTGNVVDVFRESINRDSLAAVSATGSRLVFTMGSSLVAWELDQGTAQRLILEDFDPVSLEIDADGNRAVVGSRFGMVAIWDLVRGVVTPMPSAHPDRILDAVITDDHQAITASRGALRVWDLARAGPARSVEGVFSQSEGVAISSSGDVAYAVLGDTVSAIDVRSGRDLGSISIDHKITCIAVSRNGRTVALGDESGRLHFARMGD